MKTKNNKKFTAKKRSDDYIAFLTKDLKVWECGKTYEQALGKLVITLNQVEFK